MYLGLGTYDIFLRGRARCPQKRKESISAASGLSPVLGGMAEAAGADDADASALGSEAATGAVLGGMPSVPVSGAVLGVSEAAAGAGGGGGGGGGAGGGGGGGGGGGAGGGAGGGGGGGGGGVPSVGGMPSVMPSVPVANGMDVLVPVPVPVPVAEPPEPPMATATQHESWTCLQVT
jgi:hypothetical protein